MKMYFKLLQVGCLFLLWNTNIYSALPTAKNIAEYASEREINAEIQPTPHPTNESHSHSNHSLKTQPKEQHDPLENPDLFEGDLKYLRSLLTSTMTVKMKMHY